MAEESGSDDAGPLTHDPPCVRCGHAAHPYLVCGDGCDCRADPDAGAGAAEPPH